MGSNSTRFSGGEEGKPREAPVCSASAALPAPSLLRASPTSSTPPCSHWLSAASRGFLHSDLTVKPTQVIQLQTSVMAPTGSSRSSTRFLLGNLLPASELATRVPPQCGGTNGVQVIPTHLCSINPLGHLTCVHNSEAGPSDRFEACLTCCPPAHNCPVSNKRPQCQFTCVT